MPYPDNLIQEGETVALDLRPHWWYFSRNILTGIPLAIILILVLGSSTTTGSRSTARLARRSGRRRLGGVARAQVPRVADDVLRGHQPPGDLPQRRDLQAGRRDPARADQQHQLPPAADRPHHRRRRPRHRVGGQGRPVALRLHPPPRRRAARDLPADGGPQHAGGDGAAGAGRRGAARSRARRVPEQIEQLAKLRDQGHITDAEFEQKKAELLGRM